MPKSSGKKQSFCYNLKDCNFIIFLGLLFCGSFLSAYLCNDYRWDFANYHYYNAFAFLNDRLNYDIVPASINTFFNPLIELPLYFAIYYFNDNLPMLFALQGIWGGLLLFVFYKISRLFFDTAQSQNYFWIIFALIIALSGQATLLQIGSSTNEIPIAFLILWGLYILLKMVKFPATQKLWKFLAAGFIMGIALGLKQTAITYCLSAGLMLVCCFPYLKNPFKMIALFALGGLTGFLLVNGWWMWKLWVMYDNPFFPFLNGLFQSEYFDNFNYRDERFLPNLWKVLFYPYLWYSDAYGISEVKYIDIRLTLIYSALWGCLIYCLCRHKIGFTYQKRHLWSALYIYVFISFIIWILLFSILRYAVVIEVLGALLLIITARHLFPSRTISLGIYISFLMLVAWVLISVVWQSEGWGNLRHENKFVDVEDIKFLPNTLLKLYNFPTAGLIVPLAENNKFRAVGYEHFNCRLMKGSDFVERGKFREIRDDIVKNHTGPVVIVYDDGIGNNLKNFEAYASSCAKCENFRKIGALPASWDCAAGRCPTWSKLEQSLSRELSNGYFCRPLKNNLRKSWKICVPAELKKQILGE